MAGGVLAALFNRTRTGKGEKVVANLYHSAIWGGNIGIMATQFGATYPKSREAVPNPFNNTYRTADGEWVLICMPQYDKYFPMMMELFGMREHLGDPEICNLPALKASKKAHYVVSLLEKAFATKPFEVWSPILREHEVRHQKLFHYEDVIADDEAYGNDALRVVEYQAFGKRSLPTSPVRFGSYGDPPIILSKPLGYHTREYLERFGYTVEQIGLLEAGGPSGAGTGSRSPTGCSCPVGSCPRRAGPARRPGRDSPWLRGRPRWSRRHLVSAARAEGRGLHVMVTMTAFAARIPQDTDVRIVLVTACA